MTLGQFIRSNTGRLVKEWETFARSVQPQPASLDDEELRDWAEQTLAAISQDLEAAETDEEELLRSTGLGSAHESRTKSGYEHAVDRLMQRFARAQVTCEFRALHSLKPVLDELRSHEGRIELDSSEDADTTFKVALPRRRES